MVKMKTVRKEHLFYFIELHNSLEQHLSKKKPRIHK